MLKIDLSLTDIYICMYVRVYVYTLEVYSNKTTTINTDPISNLMKKIREEFIFN